MSSREYVWEKVAVAVTCMCGDGTFDSRLESATTSALSSLNYDDLNGLSSLQQIENLKFVLDWTKANVVGGVVQKTPNKTQKSDYHTEADRSDVRVGSASN
jgi:hypothetical protein